MNPADRAPADRAPADRAPADREDAASATASQAAAERVDAASAGHPHPHPPIDAPASADSAGQPWTGRTFGAHPTAFAGDDGAAPAELIAAIAHLRHLAVPKASVSRYDLFEAQAAVIEAVRDTRLLVPLLAHVGGAGLDEHGRTVDKTQELSIVSVVAPDGRTVLPAFTSVDAMARWNPTARPIPTPARRVALAAAGEGTDLIVLDPGSPTEFVLRRPAVWAIAQSVPWHSPLLDEAVAESFRTSTTSEPDVASIVLWAGDPACRFQGTEVVVQLTLRPGLDGAALDELLARLQRHWSESDPIARAVDSLSVTLLPAS